MEDIVKRLRMSFSPTRDLKSTENNKLHKDAADEIERLREALRFYADETHYQSKKVWTTSMPQYEPDGYKLVTPVLADKGTRAKAAIAKATGEE